MCRVVGYPRAGRVTRAAIPSARRCCAVAASEAAATAVRRRGPSSDALRVVVEELWFGNHSCGWTIPRVLLVFSRVW